MGRHLVFVEVTLSFYPPFVVVSRPLTLLRPAIFFSSAVFSRILAGLTDSPSTASAYPFDKTRFPVSATFLAPPFLLFSPPAAVAM